LHGVEVDLSLNVQELFKASQEGHAPALHRILLLLLQVNGLVRYIFDVGAFALVCSGGLIPQDLHIQPFD